MSGHTNGYNVRARDAQSGDRMTKNHDQLTGDRKPRIPEPAHPRQRREPLPWQVAKPIEEDPDALRRVEAILNSPSYRLAEQDLDFLARNYVRGERLLLDYLKPELLLAEHGIRNTIVVYGSTRICEPAAARRKVEALRQKLAANAGDATLQRQLAIAERVLAKSHTTRSRASSAGWSAPPRAAKRRRKRSS
jgi:hypothetical protein